MSVTPSFPCIDLYTLHNLDAVKLAKDVFERESIEELILDGTLNPVKGFQWDIDNKYYTASTHVRCIDVNVSSHLPTDGLDLCEAVIVYFDSTQENALDDVKKMCHQFNFTPDVQLLVCESCPEYGVSSSCNVNRDEVLEWCIQHSWELVEMNPTDEEDQSEEDLEDAFVDSHGSQRIRQALHAHTWSNLDMKGQGSSVEGLLGCLQNVALSQEETSTGDIILSGLAANGHPMGDDDESQMNERNFDLSDLYRSITQCRNSQISHDERKKEAEKIALDFWKYCGGDDDDIGDLDSD